MEPLDAGRPLTLDGARVRGGRRHGGVRDAEDATFEGKRWNRFLEEGEKRIPDAGPSVNVQTVVGTLGDPSAREYVESASRVLDDLSTGNA